MVLAMMGAHRVFEGGIIEAGNTSDRFGVAAAAFGSEERDPVLGASGREWR